MRSRILVILYSLLVHSIALLALPDKQVFYAAQSMRFTAVTVQDGLSQNWVRCIYQDELGFMWFGTSGGLNRYDGRDIKIYKLGNVNVNAITKKSDHELWICNDLGVYILDQSKDSIVPFRYLQGYTVLSISKENDNIIWFGTNSGLFKYDFSDSLLYHYQSGNDNNPGLSDNYVNTLFRDSDNNLWIGTKTGLNRYVKPTDSFESYLPSNEPGSISGNDIMAICEDHNKRILIGSAKDGVDVLLSNNGKADFKRLVEGPVVSLMVDHKNYLWIGTSSNGGLIQIDLNSYSPDRSPELTRIKRNRIDPTSLSDNSVFAIYQDKFNDIWIGTFGGGVNYFSYRDKKFYSIKEGISEYPVLHNDLVNAIWDEEDYLWLGTEGGLDRYNKKTKQSKHFSYDFNDKSSLSSDPVYSVYKDRRGNFWVGTWTGGLNLFNYESETFERFIPGKDPGSISSENVFAICEDFQDNLWIGTVGGGLNSYDFEKETFTSYRHNPDDPNSIYADVVHDICVTHDGKVLVAASGALDIFNFREKNFTHYALSDLDREKVSGQFIIFIFEDSRRNIWLGTNDGLLLFNEDWTESVYFSTRDGLAGNTIQGILEDSHGNLWISTNNGLSKFVGAVDNPANPQFINFDEFDGLAGKEFKRRAAFKNKAGTMFFGTSQGCVYFHPDSISLNEIPPEVAFTEMQLLLFNPDGEYESGGLIQNINSIPEIELPYSKSDFLISFVALNYLHPQKNNYKYKLVGYDPDWVLAGKSHTATYKNLQPGRYTFLVMGSNNDGVWSVAPKSIEIEVHPPIWKTWWFMLLMVLLFLTFILLTFSWRLKAIQKEKNKLEKIVNERTSDLNAANIKLAEQSEELFIQNEKLIQNQEKLSSYKDHLEEEVRNRTRQLEQAKNKAEENDRLKTAFLANMSHEIRTPLNAITGFSGMLNYPQLTGEERKKYQHIIQSNTESLLIVIEDILDLSSIETGQIKLDYTQFPAFLVLEEMHKEYLKQLPKNIEFKLNVDINMRPALINSDEYRFRQIFTNLITNAIKFTESGKIEIGFTSHTEKHLLFYVEDTGIGISKADQEMIFDRFTKVEKKEKFFRGAGLGLAISRRLTEMMGGEMWVESEPGKGSCFYFTQTLSN